MKTLRPEEASQVTEVLGIGALKVEDISPRLWTIDAYTADGLVYQAGDRAECLYIVSASEVSKAPFVNVFTSAHAASKDVLIERIVEGCFGELEFVGRDEVDKAPERLMSCRPMAPVRLIRVPYRALIALEATVKHTVDRQLCRTAVERFKTIAEKFWLTKVADNMTLLAHTVLRLAEDLGVEEGSGRRVALNLTQQDLANEVGLSREAVNAHLMEWERSALVKMRPNEFRVLDMERLRRIVGAAISRTRDDLKRAFKSIDRFVSSGDTFRARNLALDALRFFPNSSELKYRCFLAAIRAGSVHEAMRFLDDLAPEGESTTDVSERLRDGLVAPRRSKKKRAAGSAGALEEELEDHEDAGEVERAVNARLTTLFEEVMAGRGHIEKALAFPATGPHNGALVAQAAASYERAFKATGGMHAAINAASLYFIAGDRDRAAALAESALGRSREPTSYGDAAVRGEALLLLGKVDEARTMFAAASKAPGAAPGAIAATRRQLKRLAPHLNLSEAQVLGLLPQAAICAYAGHAPAPGQEVAPEQYAEVEAEIGDRLKKIAPGIAFGALGAGSDLICAATLLRRSSLLNVVLPTHVEDFVKMSVEQRGLPYEVRAFETCLARADSLRVMAHERVSAIRTSEIEERVSLSGRQALGLALLRADELMAPLVGLAVYGANGQAATTQFARDCAQSEILVETVGCPWRPPAKVESGARASEQRVHRPLVIVWGGKGDARSISAKSTRKPSVGGGGIKGRTPDLVLSEGPERVEGQVYALDTTEAAAELAHAVLARAQTSGEEMRVICDFGAVRDASGDIDAQRVKRLAGADSGLAIPMNMLTASEPFAAEARLAAKTKLKFVVFGRVSSADNSSRQKASPSTPIFQVFGH